MAQQPIRPDATPPNNTQRNAIIIVAVLAVIVIGAILLSNRGNDTETAIATATAQSGGQPITPVVENDDRASFADEGIALGDFVAGRSLDRDSCILETDNSFASDELIYVGFLQSDFPTGTVIFVRLYRDNVALEDTDEITASEDFSGCIWFEFSASTRAEVLEDGSYEAEIFVNTRPADSVAFEIN